MFTYNMPYLLAFTYLLNCKLTYVLAYMLAYLLIYLQNTLPSRKDVLAYMLT